MYGGHIVNDFDRDLCNKYLEYIMRDELLDEMVSARWGMYGVSAGGVNGRRARECRRCSRSRVTRRPLGRPRH
jgi:hypothetical protein